MHASRAAEETEKWSAIERALESTDPGRRQLMARAFTCVLMWGMSIFYATEMQHRVKVNFILHLACQRAQSSAIQRNPAQHRPKPEQDRSRTVSQRSPCSFVPRAFRSRHLQSQHCLSALHCFP